MKPAQVREPVRRARPVAAWYAYLVVATAVATFLLIVLGGVVRATGSGMGCGPDWPLCNGRIIPEFDFPTLVEYSHRLVAALVSVLVVAVALFGWLNYRSRPAVLWPAVLALGLLAVQVVLGGITVVLELDPTVVAAHLGTANALLGTLIVLALITSPPALRPAELMPWAVAGADRARRLALTAAVAIYALTLTGAYVRGAGAELACGNAWPLCAGGLLPVGEPAWVHMAHRMVAAGVGTFLVYTVLHVWRYRRLVAGLGPVAVATLALFLVQVLVGASVPWRWAATDAQVGHLAMASAVWGAAVALAALAWRLPRPVRDDTPLETVTLPGELPPPPGLRALVADYVALTKPSIITLLLITALGGMMLAARGFPSLGLTAAVLVGGALGAGGANALNHYMDRDIDQVMRRTRRRPIPGRRVSPQQALVFGVALNVVAFALLWAFANLLAALLTLAASIFYVLVYTGWLKRSTTQNIVIGGAAGAVPPLVGWAAVTGGLDLPAIYLFAIVFFWTPPHFWALALLIRDDYAEARIPMLPVVQGEHATTWSILLYTVVLVALTLMFYTTGMLTPFYLVTAALLGIGFLFYAGRLYRSPQRTNALRLYLYSLLYLALLFIFIMVDSSVFYR